MSQGHIYVFGDIFNDSSDFASDWGIVSLNEIVKSFNALPEETEEVVVHINSRGGEVDEGFAIHDFLVSQCRARDIKLVTEINGMCGSIATVVALAGVERRMMENSTFFIHNPWGGAMGEAKDLQKYADELNAAQSKIVDFYVDKTGANQADLSELMAAETSMTSEEAKNLGFVTEVVETTALAYINLKQRRTNNFHNMKDELKALFDGFKSEIKAMLPGGSEDPIVNLDLTLADGTAIVVETEADSPAVGDNVTVEGEAAPDGTHELSDGSSIVTEGGSITEVIPAEEEEDSEEVAALKAENEQLKAEVEQLKTQASATEEAVKAEISELKEKFTALAKTVKSNHVPNQSTKTTTSSTQNANREAREAKTAKERIQARKAEREAAKEQK